MVAVIGLDDHWYADVFGRGPGVIGVGHHSSRWHRDAATGQQGLGQLLVARNAFGDGAGAIGFSGPDAALTASVAELNQVAIIQANRRHAAQFGRLDDRGGAGAQALGVGDVAKFADGRANIERAVIVGREHQLACQLHGPQRDRVFPERDDHLVAPAHVDAASPSEPAWQPGKRLQFERHVLHDVTGPGAVMQATQEPAALVIAAAMLDQRRQPAFDPLRQAGYLVGGPVLKFADVDQRLEGGEIRPHVRATQVRDRENLDIALHRVESVERWRQRHSAQGSVTVREGVADA